MEHTGLTVLYLGTLGFTEPLEQIVLCTVPLQSLLDWLSKPKGPNLVEASVAAAPEKVLVLVVTEKMLFAKDPPLVGVGLMYKLHYVSTVPLSAAYVQLNIWHSASSDKESGDKLTASCLIFVSISEMSDVIPVVVQHPVLLDVASKEAVEDTGKPMSPLSFRGFRLPRGVKEEDILHKRYETFTADNSWVQCVRCSLLGLEAGTTPSREDINASECFVPRAAASELDLPEVITNHWLPILQEEGLLVECSLDQFTATIDWVPLYTREGLERYLPVALSSFVSTGVPWLTAVVPPECHVGTDKKFLLSNFHRHGCLMRQSFTIGGRHRQLAFYPYCGVINENSNTALSHVRKHLDLHLVCRGCYSKSFLNGPALHRHMRTQCPSVTAIRDQSRTSRR